MLELPAMSRPTRASLLVAILALAACPSSSTGDTKTAKQDAKKADVKSGDAKKLDAKKSDAKKADAKADAKQDAKAEPKPEPSEPVPELAPELEQGVATSINAFAIDLHKQLGKDPGNVFVSPASIAVAFAMTHAGAKGTTADELAKTFHFPHSADLHAGFGGMLARWNAAAGGLELDVANRLFGEKTVTFETPFVALTKDTFRAPLEPVDFKTAFEPARAHINAWVAEQTHDKIKDLLPQGGVDETTRLVLVNAIYFKAQWAERFHVFATRDEPFHGTAGDETVKMMNRIDDIRFFAAKDAKARLVDVPYAGSEYAMTILLPDDNKGLPALEKAITAEKLKKWIDGAKPERVDLKLPRFRIEPGDAIALKKTLEALGVVTAWNASKADFTGMAPKSEQLAISEAYHKAFIAVDEEGTEAAAATAVSMKAGSAAPAEPPEQIDFFADHPFIFLVRDTKSGAILFMGRLVDPP